MSARSSLDEAVHWLADVAMPIMLHPYTLGILTWLGIVVGSWGLYLTYRQASEARSAAVQASTAVRGIQSRISIRTVTVCSEQIGRVKDLLQSGSFSCAQVVFDISRRALIQTYTDAAAEPAMTGTIRAVRENIGTVQHQMLKGVTDRGKFKLEVAIQALSGIAEFLIEREQHLVVKEVEVSR